MAVYVYGRFGSAAGVQGLCKNLRQVVANTSGLKRCKIMLLV